MRALGRGPATAGGRCGGQESYRRPSRAAGRMRPATAGDSSGNGAGNGHMGKDTHLFGPDLANQFPTGGKTDERISNKVQLSAYGDHIGENLKDLESFLADERLEGAIGGLHLLPVYPSSGDGGFAPVTYQEIDESQGSWEDINRLAGKYDLLMECMVNHISPESDQFQDFLAKGDASETADMWIDWARFWPEGRPSDEDLEKIRTRKPEAPCIEVTLRDGSKRQLWCTFGEQQIDINPFAPSGAAFVEASIRKLCENGAKLIRLDAFGYATKKPGTPCFMEEPEVWEFLESVKKLADEYETRLLAEVHEDFKHNIKLARKGYYVYDFALPLLVLHAMHWRSAKNLRRWMAICPRRQITVLDTHDGMGIDDITGLAEVCEQDQLAEVVEHSLGCGPNFKYHFRNGEYQGSPHQYNCTYFSALGERPQDYLLARAIQFFTPGMPMVYYVGLLAGSNDVELKKQTGNGRDVNRHRYSLEEAKLALEQPVVKALLDLCRFRNSHPAFQGELEVKQEQPEHCLDVSWRLGEHHARLVADLQTKHFSVYATREGGDGQLHCTEYNLDDLTTQWARSSLSEEQIAGIGLTRPSERSRREMKSFAEV